jgi:UDP-glucose 4-epimerase
VRILITGGAGFIGSHLCGELLQRGYEVFIIDDLSTGNIENIRHLKPHPKFHYVIDSIMNESLLAELIDECDLVFHLAAAVGVKLIVADPIRTMHTNIHGSEIVLKHAKKKKKLVLLASSSEVYGKANNIPFKEDQDINLGPTIKNRWSYACSKLIDEFFALAYWNKYKLPVVVVRLFNTVGPRQTGQYGMVLPTFVEQALAQRPITVFGDGKQTRCFAYVSDVVKGMIDLAVHPKAVGEIFNLGSNEEICIEDLAYMIKHTANSSSRIVYVSYDEAYEQGFEDMRRRVPSLEKASKLIGYSPRVKLNEIVKKVINFYKDGK